MQFDERSFQCLWYTTIFLRAIGQVTFKRSDASELVADVVPGAVLVGGAELLLATDLLVAGVAEKSFRAGADRAVAVGLADGVPAADDRPLADVPALALAEQGVLVGARLLG